MTEDMTMTTEGDCGLDDLFEKKGRFWVVRTRDGTVLPVLFCPFCGERIDYKEGEE